MHADGSFDINYVIGGSKKQIVQTRIVSTNPLVTSARRVNGSGVQQPSLLTPYHQPTERRTVSPEHPLPPSPSSHAGVAAHVIIRSRDWSRYDGVDNPLLVFLRNGKRKEDPCWLRLVEKEYEVHEKDDKHGNKKGALKSQMSERERNKLVMLKMELDRVKLVIGTGEWPKNFNPIADLAHAYGVNGGKTVRDCVKVYFKNNCSTKRKERCDAGQQTLFNSEKIRARHINAYNHFW